MNKYIDADKLIAEINRRMEKDIKKCHASKRPQFLLSGRINALENLIPFIDSLQQDKEVLDLCSQVWWEDRGWMMIPPNVTLKGIESLLERVRHKIKWNEENGIKEQEQPEVDLEKAARYVYESWNGGTMDDVRRDMVELGKVLNARKED